MSSSELLPITFDIRRHNVVASPVFGDRSVGGAGHLRDTHGMWALSRDSVEELSRASVVGMEVVGVVFVGVL